jgi:hypothetical protein
MSFDFGGAAGGAGTGATIGSAFGPWGTLAGGLIGGIGGGLLGRKKNEQTDTQKKQKELIDQLMGSLNGNGPYADLFQANEADFNKSFAEPARARFKNQTAPGIQQSYIGQGQQYSTGLQDELTRAGVDMDQLLNEHYANYQQQAQNRKAGALNGILSAGPGVGADQSWGDAALQGLGGYLSGDRFGGDIEGILGTFKKNANGQFDNQNAPGHSLNDTYRPPRKGFENDEQSYNPYTGVMQ